MPFDQRPTHLGGGGEVGRIRRALGGGGEPDEIFIFLERGLTGDVGNIAARDAQIAKLTVRKAAQLVDGLAVTAPIADVLDQAHRLAHSVRVFFVNRFVAA